MGEPVDMRYATPQFRRAATRLLAHEARGERATSAELAAASARVLDRLWKHLARVIGPIGIEALCLRAVRLRKPEFPFLDERILSRENEGPGDPFRARLQEQTPEIVREVSVTLFATIIGLLATVVGEPLARKLVLSAWHDALLDETDLQETQE